MNWTEYSYVNQNNTHCAIISFKHRPNVFLLIYMLQSSLCSSWGTLTQLKYRGADKSLARPGKEQATATEDFDVHISYLLS